MRSSVHFFEKSKCFLGLRIDSNTGTELRTPCEGHCIFVGGNGAAAVDKRMHRHVQTTSGASERDVCVAVRIGSWLS